MMKSLYIILLMLLAFSCSQDQTIESDYRPVQDALYFYTIGDWGRNGENGQEELAITMNEAAERVRPEFIISTGDNFYPEGVSSILDPQWKLSYEYIYSSDPLQCDWYVVLGNHDYEGDITAQIEYTEVSDRWNMPSQYFHKDVTTSDGGTVRFLFIDTNPLYDEYYYKANYHRVLDQDTTAQLQWIDSMLVGDFDWKIVVGHHPLYSGGTRGDNDAYVRGHLEKLFDKHQVDLYLAGHEHDLQYIKPEDHPTHHFISGAGSRVRGTGHIAPTIFARSVQGFLSTAIQRDRIICQFINVYGEIIHETEINK